MILVYVIFSLKFTLSTLLGVRCTRCRHVSSWPVVAAVTVILAATWHQVAASFTRDSGASSPHQPAGATLLHTLRCSVRGLAYVLDDSVGCTLKIKKE